MNTLIYAIAFIVVIAILVTVHEFGHFIVAHKLGVKVLRFSIGFGKPLWTRRIGRDKMEFVIAAIPLGGYVKMLDETEGKVAANERARAFNRQPVSTRIAVVAAGPLFNFAFAVLAYWAVFVWGGVDGVKPVVGLVLKGSVAEAAGFRPGDEILTIDGEKVQTWDQRRFQLIQSAVDQEKVTVLVRDPDGKLQTRLLDMTGLPARTVWANPDGSIGLIGYAPPPLTTIGAIEDGAGKRAGLQVGDRLLQLNGHPVLGWESVTQIIAGNPNKPLQLEIKRGGKSQTVTVVPDAVQDGGITVGRLNIRPQRGEIPESMRASVNVSLFRGLVEGVQQTWVMSRLTLQMLWGMLQAEVTVKAIGGPVSVAQYAGVSAQVGLGQFVICLAFISVGLGIMNLLPIPMLDGGYLAYYFIELIKGEPLSERSMMVGQIVGGLLLIAVMGLALYNDVTRILLG